MIRRILTSKAANFTESHIISKFILESPSNFQVKEKYIIEIQGIPPTRTINVAHLSLQQ